MQELLTKGIGHTEYKDTPIGKTPIEWKLEKIRDVCEVVTGGTPSTKHPEYFGGNIKWLKSGDIKQLYIYDTTEKITQLGIENSNAKIHPTDSVAIALSGRGQTRGRTTIIKVPMACSQSVAFMIPSSEIVAEYLHYNLSNRYMEIRNLTGHLDRSGLNLSIVSEIQIPVPSLTEQQKIVSILVTVDNKLDLERKEKDKLERLKRGLMGLLLTGKVRIKVD
jgi:type I restriction enzyme S subunit